MRVRRVNTILASSKASFLVLVAKYSVKTGIKAMVREPSAKRRLSRLGIRNAATKASIVMPVPKKNARTMSRTRPRMRLRKV